MPEIFDNDTSDENRPGQHNIQSPSFVNGESTYQFYDDCIHDFYSMLDTW